MHTPRFSPRIVLAPIALVIALLTTAALVVAGSTTEADTTASAAPVEIETPTEVGDDPFTPPADYTVRPTGPGDEDPDGWAEGYGPADLAPATGFLPSGPYGGTGSDLACDPELLIRELTARPDRLAAFASVLGLRANAEAVATYIRGLHPTTLAADTAVINHSFADGHATAFRAILQAGTAVLVDDRGVPVVRCRCGNPLLEPGDDRARVRRHPARIDRDTETSEPSAAHHDRPRAKPAKDDNPHKGDDDKPSDDPQPDDCEPEDPEADEHADDDTPAKKDEDCDETDDASPAEQSSTDGDDPADGTDPATGEDPASDAAEKPDPPAQPASDDDAAPSGEDNDPAAATGDDDSPAADDGKRDSGDQAAGEDDADDRRLVIRRDRMRRTLR